MDWIYATLDDNVIKKITNDILDKEIKSEGYSPCKNYKITIIPSFNSMENTVLPMIRTRQKIGISGFDFYPSIDKPMIIRLVFSNDSLIQIWQDELIDQIGRDSIHGEIDKFSIELIKGGKIGQESEFEIDPNVRDRLIDKCYNYNLPSKIQLSSINRDIWD